ncbi:hypothetical protein X980_6074 [Burkholderia pseudomallei MSHR4000]|nr:hypothetical protein X980_6074 [Burkholderia pseudomallei MSHR4000]
MMLKTPMLTEVASIESMVKEPGAPASRRGYIASRNYQMALQSDLGRTVGRN